MQALVYLCVICWMVAFGTTATAQQNTVPFNGNCRSIYFSPNAHFSQTLGNVFTYITSYDGRTDIAPQGYSNPLSFSGEARPRAIDPRVYEADYMIFSSAFGWNTEYGSLIVEMPLIDSDGNGLPDVAQLSFAVNFTTHGTMSIDWPFPTADSFDLGMVRGSNQLSGSYAIYRYGDASTSSGTIQLFNIGGTTTYKRSTSLMSFNLTITDPLATTRTVTGSTNYTVSNPNKIVLPQFSVSASGGPTYTFASGFTLNRSGSRYIGNATLSDGIPETSWADATNWVIEITDTNDWDGNGIPDLSDAIPTLPNITSQPVSQTAVLNHSASFSVAANGSMPLRYQWQLRGTNIPGATWATLTIQNVQFSHGGDYRAIVSNGGGAVTSQVATLTVIFGPDITDQPLDQTVVIGQDAQFNVAAAGTEPFHYQWRRDGTNIASATQSILFIPNAQPTNEGNYSVVVTNAAGSATSVTARLTVLIPPSITAHPQSQSVKAGATASFSVTATGTLPFSYRWMRNGTNIPNAIGANLNLPNVQPESEGVFKVMVSNGAGSVLSSNAILYVGRPLTLTNVVRETNGTIRIDLIGLPTTNYVFESSLTLSNWAGIATNSAARGILRFTDVTTPPRRFYRARVQSP